MRKLILLLTLILFISCSKSNDIPQDQIIGTWKMTQVIVDGEVFKDYTNLLQIPCVGNSEWEFDASDLHTTSYSGANNDNCIIINDNTTWNKIDSEYLINSVLKNIVFIGTDIMRWYNPINESSYWEFQRTN